MPKMIQIEAKNGKGERGFVSKMYPLNLKEAIEMWGEKDVFVSALKTHLIIDQREARPVAEKTEDNGEPKNKKRLSVMDRLAQD